MDGMCFLCDGRTIWDSRGLYHDSLCSVLLVWEPVCERYPIPLRCSSPISQKEKPVPSRCSHALPNSIALLQRYISKKKRTDSMPLFPQSFPMRCSSAVSQKEEPNSIYCSHTLLSFPFPISTHHPLPFLLPPLKTPPAVRKPPNNPRLPSLLTLTLTLARGRCRRSRRANGKPLSLLRRLLRGRLYGSPPSPRLRSPLPYGKHSPRGSGCGCGYGCG